MSETYRNYEPHTVWECYTPSAPLPSIKVAGGDKGRVRPDFCGWSALGPISLFIENVLGFYNIDANRHLVEWHKKGSGRQGLRNLRFGDVRTDIVADGNTVSITSDNAYTLVVNGKKYKVRPGSQTLKLKR